MFRPEEFPVSVSKPMCNPPWLHRLFVIHIRIRGLLPLALAATIGVAGCATGTQASAAPGPPAGSNGLEQIPAGFSEHKVNVGSLGINYAVGGHGPTVVLLHGYPETWYMWRSVMPALAEHYTVIAPELPGAGKSDAPDTGY